MHSFLPQLRSGTENQLKTPDQPGSWNDDQAGAAGRRLSALAQAILVPPSAREVHSVPDPWARVVLFERALADPKHSLHAQVLGEWRGVLAILGLRERMGFQHVSAGLVQLRPDGDPQLFSSILGRVLPAEDEMLSAGDSWQRFYILRWSSEGGRPRPFGFTSPVTLVATGAHYPKAMSERELPWFRRDQRSGKWLLTDPTPILSAAERTALAEWVLTVRQSVSRMESHRAELILRLLEAYAKDLDEKVKTAGGENTLAMNRSIGLNYGVVAPMLDKPHKPETKTLSDLLIETDVAGAPRYILIDMDASSKLQVDPKEIVVHRDITLASVRARIPDLERLNSDFMDRQSAPDLKWCKPEFFFESHLIYDQNSQSSSSSGTVSDPFPGCRPVRVEGTADSRRILFPLSEEVMKLFKPTTVEANCRVEWKGDGSALCSLILKVSKVEKPEPTSEERTISTRTLILTRTYPRESCIRISSLLPVGIWPNFRFPDAKDRWKRYYLFESWRGTARTSDFVVKPPTKLYEANSAITQKLGKADEVFLLHRMSEFPEYLRCEMAVRETPDGYQVRPGGLMLLKEPESPKMAGNRTAALGVDFGTTGTSMYWAWTDDPEPKQMLFENRLLPVTDYDHNDLKRITRDVFIPAQEWSTGKILSVYQVFHEPAPRELLDGHVLFASDRGADTFIAGDETGVRSGLKWGDDRQNEAAMGFLTQLCIQGLAELVKKGASAVAIRYSFPTAFSIEDKARFNGRWAGVRARLEKVTGIELIHEGEQVENREAVAATRFFSSSRTSHGSSQAFSISRGALTIDIGGGTTDIALWSRDKDTRKPSLMSHLSVLFAGRDIFLEPILRKPSVLVDLDPSVPISSLTEKTPRTQSYNAQLDALIADRGDEMLKDLANRQDKVKEFLSIMSTGLCGLAFYSGLMAGRLAQAGAYKPGDLIPVFVGGNGSRLLNWCAINYFQPGMPIYDKFAACVLQGCQMGDPSIKAKAQIILSAKPKEEVAYGLVAQGLGSDGSDLNIGEDFTSPLSGEAFLGRDNSASSWSASPSAQELRDGGLTVDHEMPVFRAFLKAAKLPVDEAVLAHIAHSIDDRLEQIGSRARKIEDEDADERAIDPLRKDPIFIMALKQFTSQQIDRWVSRG